MSFIDAVKQKAEDMGYLVDDWPELEPLTDTEGLPELPLQSIKDMQGSEWFINAVTAISQARNLPPEMVFSNALGAVSMLTTGRFNVFTDDGRPIPSNLYQCSIFPSGRGKSVQELLFKNIYALEEGLQQSYDERKKAAKKDNADFDEICPQMIAANITPENILRTVQSNGGRLALVSTEDSIFPLLTGLYSKGNGTQTDVVKKFFSGEHSSVNRVKDGFSGTIKGLLNVCLSTQPVSFENIKSSSVLVGDGTLSRFLYWYPEPLKAIHHHYRPGLDMTVLAEYYRALGALLPSDIRDVQEAKWICFEQAAYDRFWDYEYEKLNNSDIHDILDPWCCRNAEFAARLALNLHIIQHIQRYEIQSIPHTIEDETMAAAIEIIRINEAHARKAYGLFSYDPRTRTARKILDWITEKSIQEFKRKDLFTRARKWAGIEKSSDLNEPLALLITCGYIRREDNEPVPYRPSEIYSINPRVWAQKGAKVY